MRYRHYSLSKIPATGRCLECEGELGKGRRKYCSDECSLLHWARFDYNKMVEAVRRRDQCCQICHSSKSLEVDHIVPLADGGQLLDPNNCRLLCHACHVRVTAEWRRGRARWQRWMKGKQAKEGWAEPIREGGGA